MADPAAARSLAKLRFPLFLAYAAGCFALALGPLWLGPAQWDDAQYLESAELGQATWYQRNRYVHIWALKLATLVVQPRALAVGLYSTALVVGLGLCGYALARRSAGPGAGLCALLLMPLYPSLLRYMSTPHVDLTMALWCLVTLAATAAALDAERPRSRLGWAACAGLCGFLALESKEPGLVAAPLALYYLVRQPGPGRARTFAAWASGTALGAALLFGLDLAFTRDGAFYSANPLQYLGGVPTSAVKALAASSEPLRAAREVRLRHEYLGQLTAPGFLAFTLLGLGGAARDFARSTVVQLLTGFCFASVVLSVLVGSFAPGLQANDRYVLAPGAALTVLAALFVTGLWRQVAARAVVGWVAPLVLATLAFALWASVRLLYADLAAVRATVFFAVPVAVGLGFVGLFLGMGRLATRLTLAALLALAGLGSIHGARAHVRELRAELAPWHELVRGVDAGAVKVRLWHGGPRYPQDRVRRRLRAFSTLPVAAISVRLLDDPGTLGEREWLFTGGASNPTLDRLGLRRLHHADAGKASWSVYAR